jgi:hypothetical protein
MLTPSRTTLNEPRKGLDSRPTYHPNQRFAASIGRRIAATIRREVFPVAPSLIMED